MPLARDQTDFEALNRRFRPALMAFFLRRLKSHADAEDMTQSVFLKLASSGGTKPFFMSLHFTAPHWPWEGPEDRARAEKLTNIYDQMGGSVATYAGMLANLDGNIGKVLDALEASGLADNTIVVFTSDNGGERFSNVWPFIGIKTELLEGGVRVPLIVRWPGQVAPGTVSHQVMMSMDFMPTLLTAAGAKDVEAKRLDGVNLLPVLLNQHAPRPRTLFWRFKARGQAAVRDGDWKYLRLDGEEHLFDLASDVRERVELKDKYPEKFAALRQKFADWDKMMLPYPAGSYSHDMKKELFDR